MFSNKISNIFLYFPVCTRWRAISMRSWCRFKKLEFYMDTEQDKIDNICMQDIRIFYNVIGRVKDYLTSIKLHSRTYYLNMKKKDEINHLKVLQVLKHCPNIQELVILSGTRIHFHRYKKNFCKNKKHRLFHYLEPHCKNLTKLGVDLALFCDTSTEMAILFQKLNKLESIHLENFGKIFESNCILNFPSASLKEFMMPRMWMENNYVEMFNSMISKCVDLQAVSIVISDLKNFRDLFLHKNIKYLQITYHRYDETRPASSRILHSYFSQLIHLEKLDLTFSHCIDDELLKILAENCQKITVLNIGYCKAMTDAGIVSVSSLKKLRYLIMDCVGRGVICPKWQKMDCLEILTCMGSTSLRCQSLCDLVLNKAPNLTLLDVTYCDQVDNRLIDAALETVKSRDKNLVLTVGIFASGIHPKQAHEESDKLNMMKEGMVITRKPIVGRRQYINPDLILSA